MCGLMACVTKVTHSMRNLYDGIFLHSISIVEEIVSFIARLLF